MNTGYAAGDEEFAHEAFSKLNDFRVAGRVDENAFRMVHTDEALEIFKESAKAVEDRTQHLHTEMLKGRMPWAWAAQVSGSAVYWAWRMRTQEIGWIGDDPVNRANYAIYSTNGFHARETEEERRALLPLECPPAGTRIVADLSALITLHRLDLLNAAAEYFGEILVPEGYLPSVLEDGKKMVLHQRSRERTAEAIGNLVSAGAIALIDKYSKEGGSLAIVDEYGDSEEHRHHLIDMVQPAYEAGHIGDAAYQRVRKVCGKPSGADAQHPALVQTQSVIVELSSLETLTSFGLLPAVTEFYNVHLVTEAQAELQQRLQAVRVQDETRRWHFDLWDTIRSDSRFRFVRHTIPQDMRTGDDGEKDLQSFFASFIAQDEAVPLLADDRVCQALTLNQRQGAPHAAFGTDVLVPAMAVSGRLDTSIAADAILRLMCWRYRFVLPSASLLTTYASQYRGNPPGRPLQDVAEYVHDCLRDTGLFGGPENTDLKDSMAMRLYLTWLDSIAEWLVQIWCNEEFPDDTANELTEWCAREFLPSQPRIVHGSVKTRIGIMMPRLLLSHVLLNGNSVADPERVSAAMKALQKALKLSDDEYLRIVTEILNDTRRTEPHA